MNDTIYTRKIKIRELKGRASGEYARRMMILHDSRDLFLLRAELLTRKEQGWTPAHRARFFDYYYGEIQ